VAAKKLVPGLGDRDLAPTGDGSQQTDEPLDVERSSSVQLWASRHRRALAVAGAAGAALVAGGLAAARRHLRR
jgi:hypothetical protein